MPITLLWRHMKDQDIENGRFIDLTYKIWPHHWESPDLLIDRYRMFPQGHFIYEVNGIPSGYVMSHPGYLGNPPRLNEDYRLDKGDPNCFHIHDAAILPEARGNQAVKTLWPTLLDLARDYAYMTLISVDDTESYWSRFGFVPEPGGDEYGTYMVLEL